MRCLYCGKELAVFKRLARQEFCSDIHRREYREKYDQLALGRLLEEKAPEEGAQSGPKRGKGPITLGLADSRVPAPPVHAQPPQGQPGAALPAEASEKREPGGMAGTRVSQLIPTAVQTTVRVMPEVEMAHNLAPEQPRRRVESSPAGSLGAVQVRIVPAVHIQSSPGRVHEQRLEVRGFTRTSPLAEIHPKGAATAKLEIANTALDVPIQPQLPSRQPTLWLASAREFTPFGIESGPLGEAELERQQDAAAAITEVVVQETADPEASAVEAPVFEAPVDATPAIATAVVELASENEPEAIPEPVTRPMPVTLHGVAAGRARPVQVFSAVAAGAAVQAPRCDALPLRPLMILGPAIKREIVLPELKLSPPVKSGLSRTVKVAGGTVAGLVLAAGFFFATKNSGRPASAPMVVAGLPLPSTPNDWIQDFSPDAKRQRRVSLLSTSGDLTDYRVEFESTIQSKATGWVYRAKDPQNFYVSKVEIQKADAEPAVVAAHYAVINGEETARTRIPLPRTAGGDALYKIRFQAVGNHFTTWVQDQKVDEWTDDRIKAGGVGLYSEDGEHATLRSSFKVVPLMKKK